MVRQTASLLILEILGGLILVVLVALALLVFRLSSGPIELDLFRDDIERALTNMRDGRPVTLDEVYLEWSPEDRRVLITGYDLKLINAEGNVAASSERARIVLSGSALVFGDIEVLGLDLTEGWVDVSQTQAGAWRVAGDPLPELPAGEGAPSNPSEWLDKANSVLPPFLTALGQAQADLSLERVSFEQFEIRAADSTGKPLFKLTDARGLLARDEDGLVLSLSGSGAGDELPSGLAVDIRTHDLSSQMDISFAVAEWSLADVASRFGIDSASLPTVPADISIKLNASRETGVEQIVLKAHLSDAQIPYGEKGTDISDLDMTLTYGAQDDLLRVSGSTSKIGPASGDLDFQISSALKGEGPRDFEFTSQQLVLDMTPSLEAPIPLNSVQARGQIDFPNRTLQNTDLQFVSNEAVLKFSLDLALTDDRQENEPPILGTIELETEGQVSKETVLAFWPVSLGEGARRFVASNIENSLVENIRARLDLQRDSFAEGYLRDSDLNLTFAVANGDVSFLHDLPPVKNAAGKGRLTGNGFRVIVEKGEFAGWKMDEGLVDFPAFNPKGEDFRVFAKGQGPAANIIKVLNESRLDVDFEAERLTGDSELTFELFRPALDNVPYEDVRFSAVGTIKDAGLKDAALGLDLSEALAKINVDKTGINVSGHGELGPAPVQFSWRDGFDDDDAPSALSATAIITPDVLNRFGLPGRAYLTGEVPAEIQASIDDETVSLANVALDLSGARVDLSEIGWVKKAGDAGKIAVTYRKIADGFGSDVLFTSDDAYLDGQFTMGNDSRLISAELRRAYLANTADVKGVISRGADGNLEVSLAGTYLDLSGALPGLGALEDSDNKSGTPLRVNADVETLSLGSGLYVRDALVSWYSSAEGMQTLSAEGRTDDGSAFDINLDGTGEKGTRIRVNSGDAGFLASAFLDVDFLEGGRLELDGMLLADGKASELSINITNGRLRNAPFLTQILSLASLRGLADTLGGDGVLFSRINIPLTIAADRYVVTGGQARGPALGLTVNGYLKSDDNTINVDGVLVPSFGMNSALGGIPIIGDLVVGRDGEGVFSLTYSVRGTLEKANVSVNPLSALAPGVIRRIFENPSNTSIPEATPRSAEEPIPSELPPIPEEEF